MAGPGFNRQGSRSLLMVCLCTTETLGAGLTTLSRVLVVVTTMKDAAREWNEMVLVGIIGGGGWGFWPRKRDGSEEIGHDGLVWMGAKGRNIATAERERRDQFVSLTYVIPTSLATLDPPSNSGSNMDLPFFQFEQVDPLLLCISTTRCPWSIPPRHPPALFHVIRPPSTSSHRSPWTTGR